jgi:hypothetical protein
LTGSSSFRPGGKTCACLSRLLVALACRACLSRLLVALACTQGCRRTIRPLACSTLFEYELIYALFKRGRELVVATSFVTIPPKGRRSPCNMQPASRLHSGTCTVTCTQPCGVMLRWGELPLTCKQKQRGDLLRT